MCSSCRPNHGKQEEEEEKIKASVCEEAQGPRQPSNLEEPDTDSGSDMFVLPDLEERRRVAVAKVLWEENLKRATTATDTKKKMLPPPKSSAPPPKSDPLAKKCARTVKKSAPAPAPSPAPAPAPEPSPSSKSPATQPSPLARVDHDRDPDDDDDNDDDVIVPVAKKKKSEAVETKDERDTVRIKFLFC